MPRFFDPIHFQSGVGRVAAAAIEDAALFFKYCIKE